ncbi:MAG TPA: hypothetical protein VHW09_20610 [Bryobacteraceae bacterium]|jgi:hypothetical protein|nr:hypothetical protein [Bryobacteraceae bacterium]
MAENEAGPAAGTPEAPAAAAAAGGGAARTTNEVALELMKFIAVTTGYGKTSRSAAGFSGKPQTGSAEDHADALLELFDRCRKAVKKEE